MTLIDRACYERGCACYDSRVDRDGVEVVQRKWVGLTDEERIMCRSYDPEEAVAKTEAKLREKNS